MVFSLLLVPFVPFLCLELFVYISHEFVDLSAKEHIVGWYSTGPKLRENDLDIHQLFHK